MFLEKCTRVTRLSINMCKTIEKWTVAFFCHVEIFNQEKYILVCFVPSNLTKFAENKTHLLVANSGLLIYFPFSPLILTQAKMKITDSSADNIIVKFALKS